jgi:hypothetical protein
MVDKCDNCERLRRELSAARGEASFHQDRTVYLETRLAAAQAVVAAARPVLVAVADLDAGILNLSSNDVHRLATAAHAALDALTAHDNREQARYRKDLAAAQAVIVAADLSEKEVRELSAHNYLPWPDGKDECAMATSSPVARFCGYTELEHAVARLALTVHDSAQPEADGQPGPTVYHCHNCGAALVCPGCGFLVNPSAAVRENADGSTGEADGQSCRCHYTKPEFCPVHKDWKPTPTAQPPPAATEQPGERRCGVCRHWRSIPDDDAGVCAVWRERNKYKHITVANQGHDCPDFTAKGQDGPGKEGDADGRTTRARMHVQQVQCADVPTADVDGAAVSSDAADAPSTPPPGVPDDDDTGVGFSCVGMAQGEVRLRLFVRGDTGDAYVSREMWGAVAEFAGWSTTHPAQVPECVKRWRAAWHGELPEPQGDAPALPLPHKTRCERNKHAARAFVQDLQSNKGMAGVPYTEGLAADCLEQLAAQPPAVCAEGSVVEAVQDLLTFWHPGATVRPISAVQRACYERAAGVCEAMAKDEQWQEDLALCEAADRIRALPDTNEQGDDDGC